MPKAILILNPLHMFVWKPLWSSFSPRALTFLSDMFCCEFVFFICYPGYPPHSQFGNSEYKNMRKFSFIPSFFPSVFSLLFLELLLFRYWTSLNNSTLIFFSFPIFDLSFCSEKIWEIFSTLASNTSIQFLFLLYIFNFQMLLFSLFQSLNMPS